LKYILLPILYQLVVNITTIIDVRLNDFVEFIYITTKQLFKRGGVDRYNPSYTDGEKEEMEDEAPF
jgi:hypothetical protein